MTTTFNSEARYTCNSGYVRIGNEIRFCGLNGEWTGNPPTCVGKETVLFSVYILDHYKYDYCIVFTANCGGLLDPTNGQVSTSGTTEGSIATYSCNNGYHVVGNTSPHGSMKAPCSMCDIQKEKAYNYIVDVPH